MQSHSELNYITAYEPHLSAIRLATNLRSSPLPETGYVVNFSTVVPVRNRAGKATGRPLKVSVEPGTVIRQPLFRVQVSGAFTDGVGACAQVSGHFHVGCVSDIPEAIYEWEGDSGIARDASPHLPQSSWFPLLTGEELYALQDAADSEADMSLFSLCAVLEPMMETKAHRAATLTPSGVLDFDDSCQEMRLEMLRGIHLFASPNRPNTSLYSWMDRYLWRAAERQVASIMGLSPAAWAARRWMLSIPAGKSVDGPHTEGFSSNSLAEAQGSLQPMLDVSTLEVSNGPVLAAGNPLSVFRQAAQRAGLSPRERRIFESRHQEFLTDDALPWAEVARRLGYGQSTCKKGYAEGKQKLEKHLPV